MILGRSGVKPPGTRHPARGLDGAGRHVSPPFDWQARINESGIAVRPHAVGEPVDPVTLDVLQRIPEFVKAYDPEGMAVDEFEHYGATVHTLRQFLQAQAMLDQLVRDVLLPAT